MDLWVPEILAHLGEHDAHFFGFPAQVLREEAEGEGFEAVFELDEVPGADGFLAVRQMGWMWDVVIMRSVVGMAGRGSLPDACLWATGQWGCGTSRPGPLRTLRPSSIPRVAAPGTVPGQSFGLRR